MASQTDNPLALASFISGMVSLLGWFLCCAASFVGVGFLIEAVCLMAGVAALVTGYLGLQQARETGVGRELSIVGIVAGAITLVVPVVQVVLVLVMLVLYLVAVAAILVMA